MVFLLFTFWLSSHFSTIIPTSLIFSYTSIANLTLFGYTMLFLHCSCLWGNPPSLRMALLPSLSEMQAHLTRFPSCVTSLVYFLWLSGRIVVPCFSVPCYYLVIPSQRGAFLKCCCNYSQEKPTFYLENSSRAKIAVNLLVFITIPLSSTASHRYWGSVAKSFNEWIKGGERKEEEEGRREGGREGRKRKKGICYTENAKYSK